MGLRKIIKDSAAKKFKHIEFKLYFANRDGYVKVYIWKDQGEMHAGTGLIGSPRFSACYIPRIGPRKKRITKRGKVILTGNMIFGEVHLYRDNLGAGVVVHELLHVLFDLVYKIGIKISPPSPNRNNTKGSDFCEYLCSELEYITRGFYKRYYKLESRIKSL